MSIMSRDFRTSIDRYLLNADIRTENANSSPSISHLYSTYLNDAIKDYWLNEVFDSEAKVAHQDGYIHIHDLGFLGPYCAGFSLSDLLLNGNAQYASYLGHDPAKHFSSALMQLASFMFIMQNEYAGAIAVSNFDTLLSPYVAFDGLTRAQVKQSLQEFIYFLNNSLIRPGYQTVFSNITLDYGYTPSLYNKKIIHAGKHVDSYTYGDFSDQALLIAEVLFELFYDAPIPMTFPIPTISITKEFNFDDDREMLWNVTAKYGTPYFSNYINSDNSPDDTTSMCCFTANTPLLIQIGGRTEYINASGLDDYCDESIRADDDAEWYKPGDRLSILSIDSDGESVYAPVNHILRKKYNGNIIKVTLDDGRAMSITPDHPCFTVVGGNIIEVSAESLVLGDWLLMTKGFDVCQYDEYININGRNVELDYNFGRFVGLYLAEGCKQHNGSKSLAMYFGTDELDLVEFVCRFVNDILGIKCSYTTHYRDNSIRIAICSDHGLYDLLRNLFGTDDIVRDKGIGQYIFSTPLDFRSGVIAGFIDGDGYHRVKTTGGHEVMFHIASYDLSVGMQALMRSVGINSTIRYKKERSWRTNTYWDSYIVTIISEDIPKIIPQLNYDTKSRWYGIDPSVLGITEDNITCEKHPGAINTYRKSYTSNYEIIAGYLKSITEFQKMFITGGLHARRVASIESVDYTGYVYDVEVDNDMHAIQLPNGIVTHNCRLRIDHNEINNVMNNNYECKLSEHTKEKKQVFGLFGSAAGTGSTTVCSISLPMLAYEADGSVDRFRVLLDKYLDIARNVSMARRAEIERRADQGLYPMSARWLKDNKETYNEYWKTYFNTIGIIGMHDATMNLLGLPLHDSTATRFGIETMEYILDRLDHMRDEDQTLYNLEATPAEGATTRLARLARIKYPDIYESSEGNGVPYFSNSVHFHPSYDGDIIEHAIAQQDLQSNFTGGTVLHLHIGSELKPAQARDIVKSIANNTILPYFSITPVYSICSRHGYMTGKYSECPYDHSDGQPYTIDTYSRVVGYYRPVSLWNAGKQTEFENRHIY